MKMKHICRSIVGIAVILATLQMPALAGPPLICHPLEIGAAQSLPWTGSEWRAVRKDYDLNRLVADTLNLLGPETPVIVRMETLRRATVYAQWSRFDAKVGIDPKGERVAQELLAKLIARAQEAERHGVKGRTDALALFDAGYLLESYRQATAMERQKAPPQYDGYAWARRASEALKQNPEIEFALALMLADKPAQRAAQDAHFRRAVAGAAENSLLARNLVTHFSERGRTLRELQASASRSGK